MTDSPQAHPAEGTDAESNPEADAGTPLWVKASWILGGLLVVAFVVLHLGGHSLGGHFAHGHHGTLPRHSR